MTSTLIKHDSFLSYKECAFLIGLYKEIKDKYYNDFCFIHRDTNVFSIDRYTYFCCLEHPKDINTQYLKYLQAKINSNIQNISDVSFINYYQIVEWQPGSYQETHKDFSEHPYTSIVYLNDDYDGGETVVGSDIVTPETGSIITFKGKETDHSVREVRNNTRYTLAVWYRALIM